MTIAGPSLRRASLPLDDGWTFVADPDGSRSAAALPGGEPIRVPGSWEDHLGTCGGLVTAWYRRRLEIPADWAGDDVRLRFGAVMASCEVYLDGERVGEHDGGYLPFDVPLAGRAIAGTGHDLALRVRNPFGVFDRQPVYSERGAIAAAAEVLGEELTATPGGKQTWYTSTSGLVRRVTLERRPPVHLGRLRVRPDLAGSRAMVTWSVGVATPPAGPVPFGMRVVLEVLDPAGRVVASLERAADPGDHVDDIVVPDPAPWDLSSPALYRLRARLLDAAGAEVDAVDVAFGMRDVGTSDGRVTLNGRPVYLLGALDQDYYPDTRSTPPSREFLDRQVELARELGLNLLRCHIAIPDDDYLEAADEAGLLVWCELPSWIGFGERAAANGMATLEAMVDALGNHPSIVAWTIINEDWGTDLRQSAEQRRWLAQAYEHLRRLDPTRLAIDNSACGRPGEENFHVATDLADFHVYSLVPDHASGWRDRIADFAARPRWLWSPDGDGRERGNEPLILSEFGSWGLPDPRAFNAPDGSQPWWFATGPFAGRPGGIEERFRALGLDRRFHGIAGLVRATQEHQWEALRFEIAELRRHASVSGYVITELSDIYWEANGLLDLARRPKAFHERFAAINAPTVVVGDLRQRDWYGLDSIRVPVTASAWDGPASAGGSVDWRIEAEGVAGGPSGRIEFDVWPAGTAAVVGEVEAELPAVDAAVRAVLRLDLHDREDRLRAVGEVPLSIVPRRFAQRDPAALATQLGVEMTGLLDRTTLDRVRAGARVVVLATGEDAVEPGLPAPASLRAHRRSEPPPGRAEVGAVWEGDWITTFAWASIPGLAALTEGRCLDLAFARVLPDHVLVPSGAGPDPATVTAGLFAGWVHAPAALTIEAPVGAGRLVLTTLRLDPGNGPVARAILEDLVVSAGQPGQRADTQRAEPAPQIPAQR